MKTDILQQAKGVRDFGPAEKIERDRIIGILKDIFESFGYNPIETPVLERYEMFASRFGAGEESDAMRETFKLTDQGGRNLVLRTEFTQPFARFVGMNLQLRLPFKRYQIGEIFRDGPIRIGRYREFWQCDIDVVGISFPLIEAEILQLINEVFAKLNLKVEIMVNNRKLLNGILDYAGIPAEAQKSIIVSIDKLQKIGAAGVKAELLDKGIVEKKVDAILKIISTKCGNAEMIQKMREILGDNDGIREIEETIKYAINKDNVVFCPSLARGLAYYTGNVFEVYLKDRSKISSSICAGGRFDNMISGFLQSKEVYPAVGVSFGLETIFDAIKASKTESEERKSVVSAYIIPFGEKALAKAFECGKALRENGIKTDMDFLGRKISKNLEYANSYGIPQVVIIGDDEINENKFTLKDMKTGAQEKCSLEELVDKLK
ncbi:MAG: histidine--tRNA ligase [Parcubacteria group bacterium]